MNCCSSNHGLTTVPQHLALLAFIELTSLRLAVLNVKGTSSRRPSLTSKSLQGFPPVLSRAPSRPHPACCLDPSSGDSPVQIGVIADVFQLVLPVLITVHGT